MSAYIDKHNAYTISEVEIRVKADSLITENIIKSSHIPPCGEFCERANDFFEKTCICQMDT